MSQKMLCPKCQSYTSAIRAAVWEDESCPQCGAPHRDLVEANTGRIDEEIAQDADRQRDRLNESPTGS